MGENENPLPEVDQGHPLRVLSQENLTIVSTFTGKRYSLKNSALELFLG